MMQSPSADGPETLDATDVPVSGNGPMRAVVCAVPGQLALALVARPEDLPDGWLRVAVLRVGICGTDFHIFDGKHPFLAYPRIMGHELSARVLHGGHGFAAGDLVIVNPYLACGTCIACRKARPNCCTQIAVLGVHRDGGMCDEIAVPAANLIAAPDLTPEQAAMVEFLAIGAHAVRRSGLGTGARVLVTGVGPIGLGVALFARLRGAEVSLLDTSALRLAAARDRFGFRALLSPADGSAAILAPTGGDGYDVVFDATGNASAIEAGFAHVAHTGTFVLVSVVKDRIGFSDPEFHKREMTLLASRNATAEDFQTVIDALRSGAVDHAALHTHSTTLAEVPGIFPVWAADRDDIIKALITVAP